MSQMCICSGINYAINIKQTIHTMQLNASKHVKQTYTQYANL
jgi:hypothetical protein